MSNWVYTDVSAGAKKLKGNFDYLCEYYNVDLQTAIQLGTRSSGRKPSLPASKTCKAVSGMTMEDIWDLKERKQIRTFLIFILSRVPGALLGNLSDMLN